MIGSNFALLQHVMQYPAHCSAIRAPNAGPIYGAESEPDNETMAGLLKHCLDVMASQQKQ
jgi:hypothetical protein